MTRHGDHFVLSFRKDVTFLAKVGLKEHLNTIPDHATVVVDGSRADFIDPDVRELLDEFLASAPARKIHVEYVLVASSADALAFPATRGNQQDAVRSS